jgi:hypothetical protein
MAGDLPRRTSPKFSHRFRIVPLTSVNSLLPGTEQIFPPAMSQNIWPFRQQQEQENI